MPDTDTKYQNIMNRLRALADSRATAGMQQFGINTESALGISMPALRELAREIGKDHALADQLWEAGIHESRILACLIDNPREVTERQMDRWVSDFNSWDLCDQCCGNLFDKTKFAYSKALEWSGRDEEFVKRAGFAMMASLAVHDKRADDDAFEPFFPRIISEAADDRNYVKKAVNWALRQIGKRNRALHKRAIAVAKELQEIDSPAARWIASDALRELTSNKVQQRLRSR